MCNTDEIRILLRDPHEFGEIDGAWGAGIAGLAEDLDDGAAIRPLILTESSLAPCIAAARPGLQTFVSSDLDIRGAFAQSLPAAAAYLDLLFLRGRAPDHGQVRRVRSYGLRSAILGCVLAREMKAEHIATIADPFDEPPHTPRAWKVRAWIRFLETQVALHADGIETPDEESACKLREIALTSGKTRIQAARIPLADPRPVACGAAASAVAPAVPAAAAESAAAASTGETAIRPTRIAVEASTRSPSANRVVLRALRGIGPCGGLRVHWLARRSQFASMRARQDIRRWDLAQHLCWEEEPWAQPPHLRAERWNLLIRADPRPGARPLHLRLRARGTTVIAPAGARSGGANSDLAVEWTERSLERALATHIRVEERR